MGLYIFFDLATDVIGHRWRRIRHASGSTPPTSADSATGGWPDHDPKHKGCPVHDSSIVMSGMRVSGLSVILATSRIPLMGIGDRSRCVVVWENYVLWARSPSRTKVHCIALLPTSLGLSSQRMHLKHFSCGS